MVSLSSSLIRSLSFLTRPSPDLRAVVWLLGDSQSIAVSQESHDCHLNMGRGCGDGGKWMELRDKGYGAQGWEVTIRLKLVEAMLEIPSELSSVRAG